MCRWKLGESTLISLTPAAMDRATWRPQALARSAAPAGELTTSHLRKPGPSPPPRSSKSAWNPFSKPDHFAAAPLFEQAAQAYRACNEFEDCITCYKNAGVSHHAAGAPAAAAACYEKGAAASAQRKDSISLKESCKLYEEASRLYLDAGDFQKSADLLYKGGKLIEEQDFDRALGLYNRCLDVYENGDKEPYALDAMRYMLSALMKRSMYKQAIEHLDVSWLARAHPY